jgi:hypothetical protein
VQYFKWYIHLPDRRIQQIHDDDNGGHERERVQPEECFVAPRMNIKKDRVASHMAFVIPPVVSRGV